MDGVGTIKTDDGPEHTEFRYSVCSIMAGPMLNSDTVFFPNERQVAYGIFIFYLAVVVVIEGYLGDIQLNQAPQKPIDIRKRFKQIDKK